jgi:hypothetical protein
MTFVTTLSTKCLADIDIMAALLAVGAEIWCVWIEDWGLIRVEVGCLKSGDKKLEFVILMLQFSNLVVLLLDDPLVLLLSMA